MIWGSRVSGALRSFDPWISGWHPGSVSSGGESELCHRDGARLPLPPIRGHLPYPPSLPGSCAELIKSPILHHPGLPRKGTASGLPRDIFYNIWPRPSREGKRVSPCRTKTLCKKCDPKPQHAPPRPGNYAGMCPSVHLVSTQTPLNTVQLSAQQKMGGPTLPASAGTLWQNGIWF